MDVITYSLKLIRVSKKGSWCAVISISRDLDKRLGECLIRENITKIINSKIDFDKIKSNFIVSTVIINTVPADGQSTFMCE